MMYKERNIPADETISPPGLTQARYFSPEAKQKQAAAERNT